MQLTTKTLLLIGILLITPFFASAQSAKAGVKGGVNFSNLFIDEVDDENMRIGFHAGVYGEFLLPSGTIGIRPELLYSAKGAKGTYNFAGIDGEYKFNLDYIDLPVLLVFKLGDKVDIHAGPYVGYLINTSVTSEGDLGEYDEDIDRDNFNSFDFGLSGGIAFNFNPVSVGLRYNYGLTKIADSDVADEVLGNAKNGVGQVFISFNLKGE